VRALAQQLDEPFVELVDSLSELVDGHRIQDAQLQLRPTETPFPMRN
jgi:hypothetical protein